jgi:hypothetical protein
MQQVRSWLWGAFRLGAVGTVLVLACVWLLPDSRVSQGITGKASEALDAVLDSVEGDLPGRSPFTAVRWRGEVPEVEVDGTFYELVSLNDLATSTLVEFCKRTYGASYQKRFSEDLVEVLLRMRHPAYFRVDLVLRELGSENLLSRPGVTMTEDKRNKVWQANHRLSAPSLLRLTGLTGSAGAPP